MRVSYVPYCYMQSIFFIVVGSQMVRHVQKHVGSNLKRVLWNSYPLRGSSLSETLIEVHLHNRECSTQNSLENTFQFWIFISFLASYCLLLPFILCCFMIRIIVLQCLSCRGGVLVLDHCTLSNDAVEAHSSVNSDWEIALDEPGTTVDKYSIEACFSLKVFVNCLQVRTVVRDGY